MLNSCMRKAAAAASPVKRIGVAEMSVAESAPLPVKPASIIRRYVSHGSWPVAARTTAITPKATTSDPIGTTTDSHHGWLEPSLYAHQRFPPAMRNPISSGVAAEASSSATIAPSYITATRSASARISSRSSLITSTATPSAAASRR